MQENEYRCEPDGGLLKALRECPGSQGLLSSMEKRLPRATTAKGQKNMGGEDWPDVWRTYGMPVKSPERKEASGDVPIY